MTAQARRHSPTGRRDRARGLVCRQRAAPEADTQRRGAGGHRRGAEQRRQSSRCGGPKRRAGRRITGRRYRCSSIIPPSAAGTCSSLIANLSGAARRVAAIVGKLRAGEHCAQGAETHQRHRCRSTSARCLRKIRSMLYQRCGVCRSMINSGPPTSTAAPKRCSGHYERSAPARDRRSDALPVAMICADPPRPARKM